MKFYLIYGSIVLFRIIIHLNTQPGYIHPDEFFQTIEISAGDVLKYDILKPWEFDTAMPVRSKAIIELFLNIPLKLYLRLKEILSQVGIIIPFDLLTFCRLCTTFCSFIVDYSIYVGCRHFRINYKLALFLHSISHVSMVFLSRTFTNVWETQLLSLFVIVTIKIQREITSELIQGVIIAVGMFCRPTFLIFVSPLVLMRILQLDWNNTFRYGFNGLIGFLSVAIVLICCDTIKYGGDIVVTPWNFIKYNSNATNLEQHGRHPWFLHAVVNVPLLLGPLIIPIISSISVVRLCYKQLLISFLAPVVLLSLFPHQEMRFLLPIYPTAILLAGATIKTRSLTKLILILHVLFNLLSIVFWGYLHQGALLGTARIIQRNLASTTRSPANTNIYCCHVVITYKSLMLPKFPFAIKLDSSRGACNHSMIHNLVGGLEESQFWQRILQIKQQIDSPAVLHLVIFSPALEPRGASIFATRRTVESFLLQNDFTVSQHFFSCATTKYF